MLLVIIITVAQIIYHYKLFLSHRTKKIPYHTSMFTSKAWVIKPITGHPDHIKHNFGVCLHVFEALVQVLQEHGFV